MKNYCFLWFAFLLFSCDPVDERLIFIKEEEEKYIRLMYFSGKIFKVTLEVNLQVLFTKARIIFQYLVHGEVMQKMIVI